MIDLKCSKWKYCKHYQKWNPKCNEKRGMYAFNSICAQLNDIDEYGEESRYYKPEPIKKRKPRDTHSLDIINRIRTKRGYTELLSNGKKKKPSAAARGL